MRKDSVLDYVLDRSQSSPQGVTASEVADALGIWRNDATVELNRLVAENKLQRSGKKNIRFFPPSRDAADVAQRGALAQESASFKQYRAFSGLVGADGSLKYQLRVAMAAVTYPTNGLNMLITGSTGSGKSHFARSIWEYAREVGAFQTMRDRIPFVVFNCAEYADNPQLLLSHLFGYKKGAFTGAFEDKPGLVEEANGGILFLDEIHCLSSSGQETFFTLLDTGIFHRIGDNAPRTSRFMLIGATTKPLTDLLETFLRRMPVLISMPTLSERPMKERLELVEHFYSEEAANIGHTLRIKKNALNSVLDYSLRSNLGALKNMVQISCAKAFLRRNVTGGQDGEIEVTFSDLSFQTYNTTAQSERHLRGELRFDEDLVVPNQRISRGIGDSSSFVDVYDYVQTRISAGGMQHGEPGDVQQSIAVEIDNYYLGMERALQSSESDRRLLEGVLFPGSVGICSEFLSRAAHTLDRVYPSIAATLLAMHLSQYVSRMRSEQPTFPLSLRNSMKGYVREMRFLQQNCDWLSAAIKTPISDDEMNCLAVLLRQTGEQRDKPSVWLTLVSGSEGVASGMAKYLNSVYRTTHVHWVDSNLTDAVFSAVCENLKTFHGSSGNLIFTDIKALTTLESEIAKTSGVPCSVIPILEQKLLLEASRMTLNPAACDLVVLRRQVIEEYFRLMSHFFRAAEVDLPAMQAQMETPGKIILSICVTGIGSAKSIKEILEKRLSYIPQLRVVAISSLENMEAIAQTYAGSLQLIVGTVNPHLPGVPFITADRVFSSEGIMAIASLVDDWSIGSGSALHKTDDTAGGETFSLLVESLRFIAPHVNQELAIACIDEMTQSLEARHYKRPLPQDVRVRLFMHAASMLERIADGNVLDMEPEHEKLLHEKAAWFVFLEDLIRKSFAPFGTEIPRAEYFYFMLSLPEAL